MFTHLQIHKTGHHGFNILFNFSGNRSKTSKFLVKIKLESFMLKRIFKHTRTSLGVQRLQVGALNGFQCGDVGVWVHSLAWEIRSHKVHGVAEKKKKPTLLLSPIKKGEVNLGCSRWQQPAECTV